MNSRKEIPQIKKDKNGRATWLVDGKPYIALAGELHNSSASSLRYMDEQVWPALRPLHLNTVILPVAWAMTKFITGAENVSLVWWTFLIGEGLTLLCALFMYARVIHKKLSGLEVKA